MTRVGSKDEFYAYVHNTELTNFVSDKCHRYYMKEICPRGNNNKVVILYFLIHYKGLLFMLELY